MTKSHHPLHLFLVRHGESKSNGLNRIQGHTDSGLTARGLVQAKKIAKRLEKMNIQKIYSSDLGRAMTTAQIISQRLKKKINQDKRLREIRLGEWEGLSTDEVNEQYNKGYDEWLKSPSRMKIPGAEPIEDFHSRVRRRIQRLWAEERRSPILVVTHGGVIASLISHWLKSDFDQTLLNLRVDNTSITYIEKSSHRIKIHTLNDVSHLSPKDINQKNIFTNR